jgi:hypothetical protein
LRTSTSGSFSASRYIFFIDAVSLFARAVIPVTFSASRRCARHVVGDNGDRALHLHHFDDRVCP